MARYRDDEYNERKDDPHLYTLGNTNGNTF